MTFSDSLLLRLRAGLPLLWVNTHEEARLRGMLLEMCRAQGSQGIGRAFYCFTAKGIYNDRNELDASVNTPQALVQFLANLKAPSLVLALDCSQYFGPAYQEMPEGQAFFRALRELDHTFRTEPPARALLFAHPTCRPPEELSRLLPVLEMDLPDEAAMRRLVENKATDARSTGKAQVFLSGEDKEEMAKAALGLTWMEAADAISMAIAEDGRLDRGDVDYVLQVKQRILKDTGVLEYVNSDFVWDDVGGLEHLKAWLVRRNRTWSDEAEEYCLPPPKGVLITGVPGCGKSLCAKAIAALWKLPLLRFDVSAVFGKWVGESESNLRHALNVAEVLAPCILWLDEIEKGLSGASGGSGDGGVTRRVVGNLLTWMQEKSKPTFVIATANDIDSLPPELLRKGRFDEIFFVDLPNAAERAQIARIHLRRRLKSPRVSGGLPPVEDLAQRIAAASDGFAGGEIEQAIVGGLCSAFFDKRGLTTEDIMSELRKTVPLSRTSAEKIESIRAWGRERATPASGGGDDH